MRCIVTYRALTSFSGFHSHSLFAARARSTSGDGVLPGLTGDLATQLVVGVVDLLQVRTGLWVFRLCLSFISFSSFFFHYFYSGRGLPIFCADLQQELVDLCSAKGSLMILPTILFLSTGVLKETAVKTIDPVEVIE